MNLESASKIRFTHVTEPILTKFALAGQLFLYICILNFSKTQQMVSGLVADRHTDGWKDVVCTLDVLIYSAKND